MRRVHCRILALLDCKKILMDATAVSQSLRGFANQPVKEEEIEFVAELLLAVHEDNVTLPATALAPRLLESFDGVEWVDTAQLREISETLARVLTDEGSDSSDDEGSDEGTIRERMLAALKSEYALDKSCLAVLIEDGEWHPARIRRHVDDPITSSDTETVELRLEVEFIEFGKLQAVQLEDVVLDEDVADEDDDQEVRRCCEMCARETRLSFHHLTPRVTHARYLKKGFTREFLNMGVMICRPCHSKIHSSEDNKTLARDYNTLEKIMGHPEILRFVRYVSKQRATSKPKKTSRWPVGK